MLKRSWAGAIASCVAMPAVALAGGLAFAWIDPELARHTGDYARNYRLISIAKHAVLLGALGACAALWVLACGLALRSKARAWGWLALAALGPFGLAVIASLDDRAPAAGDAYARFTRAMRGPRRAAYELACFAGACVLAFVAVVAFMELQVRIESTATGTALAAVVARRDASSGMAALGEAMAMLYLLALAYLLRPLAIGLLAAARR